MHAISMSKDGEGGDNEDKAREHGFFVEDEVEGESGRREQSARERATNKMRMARRAAGFYSRPWSDDDFCFRTRRRLRRNSPAAVVTPSHADEERPRLVFVSLQGGPLVPSVLAPSAAAAAATLAYLPQVFIFVRPYDLILYYFHF